MHSTEDTICALSTAPGRSGLAVVRISGAASLRLALRVFTPEQTGRVLSPRQSVLGRLRDPQTGGEVDQAVATWFQGPHSYTGEDVVEISLHGSPVIVEWLLDSLCALGARLAHPGEFTMRAFLRGRVDLVQAESVRDVIESSTLYQAQVAARQRSGELSKRFEPAKRALISAIVQLETAVEFVEEDLPAVSRQELAGALKNLAEEFGGWVRSFRKGRVVREGFSLAIVGRPNVGKSSLFNALLAQDRSIVTEVPGTTRDLVSEVMSIEGIPVRLVDTAGVRQPADLVEQMGVDRSYRAMADADAVLLVVDVSEPPDAGDEELQRKLAGLACLVVFNKIDRPRRWSDACVAGWALGHRAAHVSALTGAGMDLLGRSIMEHLFGDAGTERESVLITNVRHARAVENARTALERAADALAGGVSEEFVLTDLHAALKSLGTITGETAVEDVLNEIFGRFCVGK